MSGGTTENAHPEVPGSEMHELVHADGVWAGLTRFTTIDGPSPWTPSERGTIHVLQGEVTIEIADGPALTGSYPISGDGRLTAGEDRS